MKKVLFVVFALIGFAIAGNAQARKIKFYYYPSTNVYYNTASGKYIYNNSGKWTTVNTLPPGLSVAKTQRVIVYHSTPDVWTANNTHAVKYKVLTMKPVPPGHLRKKAGRK